MKLSEHFSLQEMTVSETAARRGLDNVPDAAVVAALGRTCEGLERIRALAQKPIVVLSGYRSPSVNAAVGGSARSQHMAGEAADIICPGLGGGTGSGAIMLAALVRDNLAALGVDQLIYEFGAWVHVSFPGPGRIARAEVLTIGRKGALPGLVA